MFIYLGEKYSGNHFSGQKVLFDSSWTQKCQFIYFIYSRFSTTEVIFIIDMIEQQYKRNNEGYSLNWKCYIEIPSAKYMN